MQASALPLGEEIPSHSQNTSRATSMFFWCVFLKHVMKALDIFRKVYMRISFPSTLLGFVLLSGLTANSLRLHRME